MSDKDTAPPAASRPLHTFAAILGLALIPLALSAFGSVDEAGRGPESQNANMPAQGNWTTNNRNANSNGNISNSNTNAGNANMRNSNAEIIPDADRGPSREPSRNGRGGRPPTVQRPGPGEQAESTPREEGLVFPRPKSFDDVPRLRKWLEEMAKDRLALIDIVCLEGAVSLFTLQSVKDANVSYDYELIADPLSETNMKRAIEAHPKQAFVGVYKFRQDRYVLVFRVK